MIKADQARGTIESVIDDNELIIYVYHTLSFDVIGVPAIEFVPDYGDLSHFDRVCIDLSAVTRLELEGIDYLNKYYYAAKEAKLSFRVTGVAEVMVRVFAMAGVTWPIHQREVHEVPMRRTRRQINLRR